MKVERDVKAAVRPANIGNIAIGLVIFVCSLFFVLYLVPNHIQEPPFLQNPMMSPRFLPGIVGWLTVVFSLLLALDGVFGKASNHASESGGKCPPAALGRTGRGAGHIPTVL
ncbi:MAG: hypothetical protein QNL70_13540 [Pseudomonas sp.]